MIGPFVRYGLEQAAALAETARARTPAWLTLPRAEVGLAAAALIVGLITALATLDRGLWLDEFWTLSSTEPGLSMSGFFVMMAGEVHPVFHYGLVWALQALGVTDPVTLRAVNLVAVPIVLWAIWFAWRNDALNRRQGCIALALFASSAMFLDYVAEIRTYCLLFAAAIAVAIVWRVLARRAARNEPWTAGVFAAWFVTLAVFVNMHYFATLLGGVLTAALLLIALARGRPGALTLAVLSALAAAPAVGIAVAQMLNSDESLYGWIGTGRISAIFVITESMWLAMSINLVATAAAGAAVFFALERAGGWRDVEDELVLATCAAVFYGLLVVVNTIQPIVVDRYLVAGGGLVLVVVALAAGGPAAPRWGALSACGFAVLVAGHAFHQKTYKRERWRESASALEQLVAACPSSPVYIDPIAFAEPDLMFVSVRRYGQQHYLAEMGLSAQEVGPGDTIPSPEGDCPALVWMEHTSPPPLATADTLLEAAGLSFPGRTHALRVGSGSILILGDDGGGARGGASPRG